jgi:Glycosyltransferase family 92
MTYRDEAPYLREWIEFHRLVGVERFFLYDTGSTDEHEEVLAPYVDSGIVTVEEWHGEGRQDEAIDHCLAAHADVRWIVFIDADEFLFSPVGRPLPDVLFHFEEFPGVGVNRAQFATSGHVSKPSGLVIENYIFRFSDRGAKWVKCIVQPARPKRCRGSHVFEFDSGHTVDVKKRPLDGGQSQSFIQSRLRINHYYTKSLGGAAGKYAKTRADTGEMRPPPDMRYWMVLEAKTTRDLTILQYVPALKQRLQG